MFCVDIKITDKSHTAFMQMSGCAFLMITICVWQLSGCNGLSYILYFLGIASLYGSSLMALRVKDTDRQFRANTILLLLIVILSLIYLCVNANVILSVVGIIKLCMMIGSLFGVAMAQAVQLYFTRGKMRCEKGSKIELFAVLGLAVILGFLLNFECFNTWPRWDPFHYYYSFEKVSARNIFMSGNDGLIVCGHNSMAYCLWNLLFRMIPGVSNLNAMYLANMTLVAIDVVLLYLIFKKIFKNSTLPQNILYTFLLASSTWILGYVANLNLENFMMTGSLVLIYAVFSSNSVLGVVGVFIACFSKETGALIAAIILFVKLLYDIIRYIKQRKGINYSYYILNLIVGCLWLVIFIKGNWGNKNLITDRTMMDGTPYNTFNFSLMHIKDVLIQSFIIDFNWIFLCIIIFTLGYTAGQILHKGKRIGDIFRKKNYVILGSAFLICVGEMCAFLTGCHHRYYITPSVILGIIALCGLQYVLYNMELSLVWQYAVPGVLCVVMFVQSYRFIDPITMTIYPKVNTGEAVMVQLPAHSSVDKDEGMTEASYSNRQIMYLDKTLDKVYEMIYGESNLESTKVLCSNEYATRIINNTVALGSLYNIWGFGYLYVDPPMWAKWNKEGGYRYLSYEQPANLIEPDYVMANTNLSGYINDYEHVYYLKMPWGDTVLDELQKKYPSISIMQTIKYRGWIIEIYQIK